jgi:8-oxo-dGTP pyrophosphatase MutT (NUDIX family)
MAENPSQYAKLAQEGLMLGHPVKINGETHRPDNNVQYHSTVKDFDKQKDHPHAVHQLAQHLPLNPPDAKNTQISFDTFKDRMGNDVHVIKLHGNSADKMKEHNGKFSHMGHPSKFEWTPHISVPKDVHDKIKSSGVRTAHEAGIEFGPAELKSGPKTLKTYHHQPDSAEPKFPDEGDLTAKIPYEPTKMGKSENLTGLKKNDDVSDDISIDDSMSTDEDSHALLNRQEDKYFLPKHNIEKVITTLSERLALGDIDTDTRYNTNRTIYLDDKDLNSLHDCMSKKKPRLKVRIRQYSPNSLGWEEVAYAEFKMKDEDGLTKKIRVRIPSDMVESLSHGGQITMSEGLVNINKDIEKRMLEARVYAINSAITRKGLMKQLEVRYERRAYTGNNIRITIDENLRYLDAREVDPNVKRVLENDPKWKEFLEPYIAASWENPFIMEVKSDGKVPAWINTLLKECDAEEAHFSKYCAAIVTHLKTGLTDSKILGSVGYLGTVDNLGKSENSSDMKPLMKPFVSEAQRRWGHTQAGKEALGGNAGVHEWDEATKGKKLPERVSKSDKKICMTKPAFIAEHKKLVDTLKHPSKKGVNEEIKDQSKELEEELAKKDKGDRFVDIAVVVLRDGNFVLMGRRRKNNKWGLPGGRAENGEDSKVAALRELEEETGLKLHPEKLMLAGIREVKRGGENKRVHVYMAEYPGGVPTTEEDPDEEFTKWKWVRCENDQLPDEVLDDEMSPPAEAAFEELDMTKDEQFLGKGALKTAGVALGMAGALAGSSPPSAMPNRAPASIQQPKQAAPLYDHKKMLDAISQVESSGGKNLNHTPTAQGTAYGRYALMPNTIHDTIKGHKDLKSKYGKALALNGPQLARFMQDNKGLEDIIADRHLAHIEHNFKNNLDSTGFAWNQGITGTKNAKNKGIDITTHPYTQKIREAYGKEK